MAPLVPFSRTPVVLLLGEVEDRVVAEDGRPVVRPMVTIGVTFDHRFMDGFQGGKMLQIFRVLKILRARRQGSRHRRRPATS
jgi:pyruvate dehydrogenase E2 component (dihydrolipoamide acetyltransferase)